MKKGIGPNNLGAPKGVGKMYNSPAKKGGKGMYSRRNRRRVERDYALAEKNPEKAAKRAVRLSEKAENQYAKGRYNKGNVTQARAETLKFNLGMSPIRGK